MMKTKINTAACLMLAFFVTACTAPAVPPATVTPLPPPTATRTSTPRPTDTPAPTETVTPTPDPAHTEYHVISDRTWLFMRNPPEGWKDVDFDDSSWSRVSVEENRLIPASRAADMWEYPYHYNRNDTLYFRKVFNVQVVPSRARLVVAADDSVNVYVNGNLVYRDSFRNVSFLELDVTGWLQPGKNVLALQGTDVGQGAASVVADLGLCPAETPDRYSPHIQIMHHWTGESSDPVWFEAMDAPCDSGVTELVYRIDGGEWMAVSPHKYYNLPRGTHLVEARATDGSGKQGFDSWTFRVK
ncbi:MAG: hypothetical protein WCC12_08430 [Anaerolineales bacterium]